MIVGIRHEGRTLVERDVSLTTLADDQPLIGIVGRPPDTGHGRLGRIGFLVGRFLFALLRTEGCVQGWRYLALARRKRGISTGDMAGRLFISRDTLWRLERGDPTVALGTLATATFVPKADNVVLLGPPGIGKTHLAIGLGIKAAQAGNSSRVPGAEAAAQELRVFCHGPRSALCRLQAVQALPAARDQRPAA